MNNEVIGNETVELNDDDMEAVSGGMPDGFDPKELKAIDPDESWGMDTCPFCGGRNTIGTRWCGGMLWCDDCKCYPGYELQMLREKDEDQYFEMIKKLRK